MLSGFQEAGRGGGRTSQPSLVPDVVWLQQTGRCDYLLINVALCQPQAAGADRNRPNTSALSVGGLVQRGVQQTSSRPQVWLRPCPRYHTPQEDKEQRSVISRRNSEGGGGLYVAGISHWWLLPWLQMCHWLNCSTERQRRPPPTARLLRRRDDWRRVMGQWQKSFHDVWCLCPAAVFQHPTCAFRSQASSKHTPSEKSSVGKVCPLDIIINSSSY